MSIRMDGREAVFYEYRGREAVSGSMDGKAVMFASINGNEAALVSMDGREAISEVGMEGRWYLLLCLEIRQHPGEWMEGGNVHEDG